MLEEVRRQVGNLDVAKYKVALVWDPVTSRDVGWLTVKRDVRVDLPMFQVRDVNLETLVSMRKLEFIDKVPQTCDVSSSLSSSLRESNQEENCEFDRSMAFNKSGDLFLDENENMNNKTDQKIVPNPYSRMRSGRVESVKSAEKRRNRGAMKRQCPECLMVVTNGNFMKHFRVIHNQLSATEKVPCDICEKNITKINLDFHKYTNHGVGQVIEHVTDVGNELKCDHCGKQYRSYAGLRQHKLNEHIKKKKIDNEIISENKSKEGTESVVSDQGLLMDKLDDLSGSVGKKERVRFNIRYKDRSYSCSRSKGNLIKGSLKKFCKQFIGKDLQFEFDGKILTGLEVVERFSGSNILARSL